MAGSLNKVTLIGNLGKDPEVKSFSNGGEVCNFSIATSESWKDKTTGERKENTQWHNISVLSPGLVGVCKSYLKKGSKVYLEGQLETRSWENKEGQKQYTTEVVLRGFDAKMLMLDGRSGSGSGFNDNQSSYSQAPANMGSMGNASPAPIDELEDEIPF